MYLLLRTDFDCEDISFHPIKVSKDKNKIKELLKNAEQFELEPDEILKKEDYDSSRIFYYTDDKCTRSEYSIEYVQEV